MKITQKELMKAFVKEFGSIVPAKCGGRIYRGIMMGSESRRRCLELEKEGWFVSKREGKFVRFFAKPAPVLPPAFEKKEEPVQQLGGLFT